MTREQRAEKRAHDLLRGLYGGEKRNERVRLLLRVAHPSTLEEETRGEPWTIAGDVRRVGVNARLRVRESEVVLVAKHVICVSGVGDVIEIDGTDELVVLGVARGERD